MRSTQLSVIDIITSEIEKHPKRMNKCILDSHKKIVSGMANRVFDDFPLLLTEGSLQKLIEGFSKILDLPNMKLIRSFEKKLIKMACQELLETNGTIKNQILEKLQWSKYESKIDNYNIIAAYVGASHAWIVNQLNDKILNNKKTFSVIMNIVNPNYGQWIVETMRELNMKYDKNLDKDQTTIKDILVYPIKHPLFTLSFLSFGIFGGIAYGVGKLLKDKYDDNVSLSVPESPPLSPHVSK